MITLVDCLALWNELNMNGTLDMEESDEHSVRPLRSVYATQKHLTFHSFSLISFLEHWTRVTCILS